MCSSCLEEHLKHVAHEQRLFNGVINMFMHVEVNKAPTKLQDGTSQWRYPAESTTLYGPFASYPTL